MTAAPVSPPSSSPPIRAKAHPRWRRWLLWVAGFIGVGSFAFILFLPVLIEHAARTALRDLGFAENRLHVADWSLDALVVEDISVDRALHIERLVVDFDLRSLLARQTVRSLTLRGVQVQLPNGAATPLVQKIIALSAPADSVPADSAQPAAPWTIAHMDLQDVRVDVGSELGPWHVQADLTGHYRAGVMDVQALWELMPPLGLPALFGQATLADTAASLTVYGTSTAAPVTSHAHIQTADVFDPHAAIAVNATLMLSLEALVSHRDELTDLRPLAPQGQIKLAVRGATSRASSTAGDVPDLSVVFSAADVAVADWIEQGQAKVAFDLSHISAAGWQATLTDMASFGAGLGDQVLALVGASQSESYRIHMDAEAGTRLTVHLPHDLAGQDLAGQDGQAHDMTSLLLNMAGTIRAKLDAGSGRVIRMGGPLTVRHAAGSTSVSTSDCLALSTSAFQIDDVMIRPQNWCLRTGVERPEADFLVQVTPRETILNTALAPLSGTGALTWAGQTHITFTDQLHVHISRRADRPGVRLYTTVTGLDLNQAPLIATDNIAAVLTRPVHFEGDIDATRLKGYVSLLLTDGEEIRSNVAFNRQAEKDIFSLGLQPVDLTPERSQALLDAIPMLTPLIQPEAGRLNLSITGDINHAGDVTAHITAAAETLRFKLPGEDEVTVQADRLEARGPVVWSGAAHNARLDLLLKNVGVRSGYGRADRINGVIRVRQLVPFRTEPQQELAVAVLDAGVVLPNGAIRFDVQDRDIQVHRAEWSFARGTVALEDIRIRNGQLPENAVLAVDGLHMTSLFPLIGIDGLDGNGVLSGRIPVDLSEGRLNLSGGISAREPGVLRFDSRQTLPGLPTEAEGVLEVLEDFQYETFALDIIPFDATVQKDMMVKLRLFGHNPTFRDGIPVNLNINLEGDFESMARAGLQTYDLPARIADQMYSFPTLSD